MHAILATKLLQKPFFYIRNVTIQLLTCRAGEYTAARAKYKECLQHAPADVQALSNLSAVHIQLQEWQPALACAQTVLKSEPQHFKCLCRAGKAKMHLERYHSALACLKAAVQQVESLS